MSFKDKVVWITGASSGIGEALVYAFVAEGAQVILSARREAELERVKSACGTNADQCTVLPLDLTDTKGLELAAKSVIDQAGRVDILVNNGGMSQRSLAHETDLSVDRRIMEVNYFGQITLTKALLPQMIRQGGGHIAVLSSVTGKFGFYQRSAYAASKHALHGFFETLGMELASKNVYTTLVCPGRIQTNISLHALTKDGSAHAKMDPGQVAGISAEDCARQILHAIRKRKKEVYIGSFSEKLVIYLKRFVPALFYQIIKTQSPV